MKITKTQLNILIERTVEEGVGDWIEDRVDDAGDLIDDAGEFFDDPGKVIEDTIEDYVDEIKQEMKDELEDYLDDNARDIADSITEKLPLPFGIGEDEISDWLTRRIKRNSDEMADCIVTIMSPV